MTPPTPTEKNKKKQDYQDTALPSEEGYDHPGNQKFYNQNSLFNKKKAQSLNLKCEVHIRKEENSLVWAHWNSLGG